jgi:hypothetical protein
VQGRMGRTAALPPGPQDALPGTLDFWTFAFLGFCEIRPYGVFRNSRPAG